jgi:methylglutaconyl-CoA hydratase
VTGAALGGGMGLIAASDIVVAAEGTQFGFTGVRLASYPQSSPPRAAEDRAGPARRWFLTGGSSGSGGADVGLVRGGSGHGRTDAKVAESRGDTEVRPQALATAKVLVRDPRLPPDEAPTRGATIAQVRVSEAQDGLDAFIDSSRG